MYWRRSSSATLKEFGNSCLLSLSVPLHQWFLTPGSRPKVGSSRLLNGSPRLCGLIIFLMLQRLLELRTEVFLAEKSHPLAHKFSDSKWLMQVAYLADMFAEINSLNISMQGRDQTVVGLSEKLSAFKGKLKLWMNKIKTGKTASFPSLSVLLSVGG